MLIDAVVWLGHSGFRIQAGRESIYIDPYRAPDGPPAAVILITHGHYDHFSPQDVERLSGEETTLVAPAPVAERLAGQVRSIAPGEALELGRIDVRAIAAYNTSKRDPSGNLFHPRESGSVGGSSAMPVPPGRSTPTSIPSGPGAPPGGWGSAAPRPEEPNPFQDEPPRPLSPPPAPARAARSHKRRRAS